MTSANNTILSGSSITFHIAARLKDIRLLGLSARGTFYKSWLWHACKLSIGVSCD